MQGERVSRWAGIVLAAMLGIGCLAFLLQASVTVGAGDSVGFERPVRDLLRAANRALVSTGWTDGWRIAAWAGGASALAGAVLLVWLASRVRDEPLREVADRVAPGSAVGERVRTIGTNGNASAESGLASPAIGPGVAESSATGTEA